MDALKLLQEDHDRMRRMLDEGESTTERAVKTRSDLFARLKHDLEIHERMEEEVLYAKENLEHHIDEEENEAFPLIRKAFSDEELEELGGRMQEIKQLAQQVLS